MTAQDTLPLCDARYDSWPQHARCRFYYLCDDDDGRVSFGSVMFEILRLIFVFVSSLFSFFSFFFFFIVLLHNVGTSRNTTVHIFPVA